MSQKATSSQEPPVPEHQGDGQVKEAEESAADCSNRYQSRNCLCSSWRAEKTRNTRGGGAVVEEPRAIEQMHEFV